MCCTEFLLIFFSTLFQASRLSYGASASPLPSVSFVFVLGGGNAWKLYCLNYNCWKEMRGPWENMLYSECSKWICASLSLGGADIHIHLHVFVSRYFFYLHQEVTIFHCVGWSVCLCADYAKTSQKNPVRLAGKVINVTGENWFTFRSILINSIDVGISVLYASKWGPDAILYLLSSYAVNHLRSWHHMSHWYVSTLQWS